jgi:hypothetical protein
MNKNISGALKILSILGLPRAQINERSALCLLALLNFSPGKNWGDSENPLIGITPIMDWIRDNYRKKYAPNTRETIRRQTMHQFVDAGIALYNPDDPSRPVNSPKAVYQIEPETLELLKSYRTSAWKVNLKVYLSSHQSLTKRYALERNFNLVPVVIASNKVIKLSPGEHSELIKSIIEGFAPRFAPRSILIYAGDTGDKWGYFDKEKILELGIEIDAHGKMPDVVLYNVERKWIIVIEAVTSHGPVDSKRHRELARLFNKASAALIFITAFPNRNIMARYLPEIAWETEVWVADAPSHLIHFDGERFLGPYNP